MWLPEARVAVRWCHTVGVSCNAASALPMCRSCLKNTFINRLEKHTQMSTIFVLATGCANGFTMSASLIYGCSDSYCSGDALWYAAQMYGFCIGCCGVRTLLQHVGCICGSAVLCNVDTAVVHSVRNIASTVFCDCIADVAASVHHRACRLRCKRFAPCVAMLSSSAASAKQYGRRSFALFFGLDADMRDTDVCGNLHRAGWCILLDALIAVGGEISESARTCFREYLQCADLTFPNFKATASSRLKPHAKSTVRILMNTNRSNFSKGNVGSRLGATEWTGSLRKCPRIACLKWRKDSDKASE